MKTKTTPKKPVAPSPTRIETKRLPWKDGDTLQSLLDRIATLSGDIEPKDVKIVVSKYDQLSPAGTYFEYEAEVPNEHYKWQLERYYRELKAWEKAGPGRLAALKKANREAEEALARELGLERTHEIAATMVVDEYTDCGCGDSMCNDCVGKHL